jgi:hypothetical protein
MKTTIINLGGDDYSVQYEIINNKIIIDSVNNMSNKELYLTDELEQEILDKINN